MRWLIVATIAVLATAGCRSDPEAKARAEKARESAQWDKAFKDAERVQEKGRQRAERQRQQMLDKANKDAEKE